MNTSITAARGSAAPAPSPVESVTSFGQRLWLDQISRSLLDKGKLGWYMAHYGVTGLTSNPAIFDRALASGDYDEAIRTEPDPRKTNETLFFDLALDDLTRAADLFRPVHDATGGADGWVSLEISPRLAFDAEGSVAAARRLFQAAGRSNLFIKVPGTRAGLEATEELIFEGIPINVTLLFSREQYRAAAEAYMRGLERRQQAGLAPDVASVASLFVSRWDRMVADQLPAEWRNRLGITLARRTYTAYRDLVNSMRWRTLARDGARPQKLLWASTAVRDGAERDTLYAESLVAPETVNTLPENTLIALADHGHISGPMELNDQQDRVDLARFIRTGMNLADLAKQLQHEGVQTFMDAWNQIQRRIDERRKGRTGTTEALS